ncbi:tail fiber domain-containing protein [Emticicia agri]|uniref:Peptidase S74 domain-containing protein n=1 Tax=Emticicia agri TaxID=2492393 RepID=A0A4Q5LSY1_9BACT|nr:tail fiber domain-containing protein [Emticicia agri]RYU92642.1 hypothetical protein EWM59_26170 [Emticicia agri]
MKKLLLLMSVLLSGGNAMSQSITLEPGLLLPKMTTTQRINAGTKTNGMLVFDTNTQSYWYWQANNWIEIPRAGGTANYWALTGNGSNVIGNVNSGGFWSKNPTGLSLTSDNVSHPPTVPVNEPGTRLMWIPGRSAFRVGTVTNTHQWAADSIGLFSMAAGLDTKASGWISTALGFRSKAEGQMSFASGESAVASGYNATAMGKNVRAAGNFSVAIGIGSFGLGESSMAIGTNTFTNGHSAVALGTATKALAMSATAIGENTVAEGNYSMAAGLSSRASGYASTAMGNYTHATGTHATALGYNTTSSGLSALSAGSHSIASGRNAFAMGDYAYATGDLSTAIGASVVASGYASTAIGTALSTNGQWGAFVIGDTDPDNEGTTFCDTPEQFVARFRNGFYLYTGGSANPRTGVRMHNGQSAWSSVSDSTKKEKFLRADGESFLLRLRSLRLGSWNYKQKRHTNPERFYGPMAQEVFAAFGRDTYGTIGNDTTVSTMNMDGLLFIFAQALEKRTHELKAENEHLRAESLAWRNETQALKTLIQQLVERVGTIEAVSAHHLPQGEALSNNPDTFRILKN